MMKIVEIFFCMTPGFLFVSLHAVGCQGTYYEYVDRVMDHQEGVSECNNRSLQLASIPDPASNSLALAASSHSEAIIGLTRDASGEWKWPDGSSATWTNWTPLEPAFGDCCKLLGNGSWAAIHCTATFRILCGAGNGSSAGGYSDARYVTFVDVGGAAPSVTSMMTVQRPHDLACARLCGATPDCDAAAFTRSTQRCDLYTADVSASSPYTPTPDMGVWVKFPSV